MVSARLTLPIVLVVATSVAVAQDHAARDALEKKAKSNLKVDRAYVPSDRVELTLALGEAARLKFAENEAGVSEFLFLYETDCLQVLYACAGESYDWTSLTTKRPTDSRTISNGAPVWMKCTTEWKLQDGKAVTIFHAELLPKEDVRRIQEAQKRAAEERMNSLRRVLEWDEDKTVPPIRMTIPNPDDPDLVALRKKYELDEIVAGTGDDYDRLQRMLKWVHERWQHTGDNTPSRPDPLTILAEAAEGKRFRCVEYATVTAGCAQALGMPARTLGLKREDAETAKSGAGHLVAEVWLASRKKWVFADGQWDAIPEKDGVPLNAVEFQEAFGKNAAGLSIRSSSKLKSDTYFYWVAPYLYYFDCHLDQGLFGTGSDRAESQRYQPERGMVMLCPKGAKKPAVFQGKAPIKNCTYISSPRAFYPRPTTTAPAE